MNDLQHHGILGQHWGRKNGPPYPLDAGVSSAVKKKGLRERMAEHKEKVEAKKVRKAEIKQAKQLKKEAVEAKKEQKRARKEQKVRSRIQDPKKMTDEELRNKINRLQLEKQYYQLTTPEKKEAENKAVKFVEDILGSSARNIATQTSTYLMGTLVNKMAGAEIVNPKKGQKDK